MSLEVPECPWMSLSPPPAGNFVHKTGKIPAIPPFPPSGVARVPPLRLCPLSVSPRVPPRVWGGRG